MAQIGRSTNDQHRDNNGITGSHDFRGKLVTKFWFARAAQESKKDDKEKGGRRDPRHHEVAQINVHALCGVHG